MLEITNFKTQPTTTSPYQFVICLLYNNFPSKFVDPHQTCAIEFFIVFMYKFPILAF
jgi:hypothetical protein